MTKKNYNYDPTTKEHVNSTVARESPAEEGVYLLPANATFTAPPVKKEGFVCCFIDDKWEYQVDLRGAESVSITEDGAVEVSTVTELGELEAGTLLSSDLELDEKGDFYAYYKPDGKADTERQLQLELKSKGGTENTWRLEQLLEADNQIKKHDDFDEKCIAQKVDWQVYRRALRNYITSPTPANELEAHQINDLSKTIFNFDGTDYPVVIDADSGRPVSPS